MPVIGMNVYFLLLFFSSKWLICMNMIFFYTSSGSELQTRATATDSSPCLYFTEAHEYGDGNPLLALLLLLGIPAGICCCCRKKIFRKKATNATMLQVEGWEGSHPVCGENSVEDTCILPWLNASYLSYCMCRDVYSQMWIFVRHAL